MTRIVEIVPGGTGLFQVEVEDDKGRSSHEVAVPAAVLADLLGDEAGQVALQSVALAAVDWRLQHEPRQDLPRSFSVADLRDVADFDLDLPARIRRWDASPPPSEQAEDEQPGPDTRLVREVQREQEEGQASSPRDGRWRHTGR